MLEVFFDNEKVFSVFSEILKQKSTRVNVFEICYSLGIEPEEGAEILRSLVVLGILKETRDLSSGIFEFDYTSKIALGLCVFDEFVEKYVRNKYMDIEGEEEFKNLYSECSECSCDIDLSDIFMGRL